MSYTAPIAAFILRKLTRTAIVKCVWHAIKRVHILFIKSNCLLKILKIRKPGPLYIRQSITPEYFEIRRYVDNRSAGFNRIDGERLCKGNSTKLFVTEKTFRDGTVQSCLYYSSIGIF